MSDCEVIGRLVAQCQRVPGNHRTAIEQQIVDMYSTPMVVAVAVMCAALLVPLVALVSIVVRSGL